MPTLIGSLCRAASRGEGRPLNVLTFPTHERYESGLCLTGHDFFAVRGPGIKDWNATYAPVPKNYRLLDPSKGSRQLPTEADFDLVLCQNKSGQYNVASQLSRQLHLPLVCLEHTLPPPVWGPGQLEAARRVAGHVNVFISEYSRGRWGWDASGAAVVRHGVDSGLFSPGVAPFADRKPNALSVVNQWASRDWCCGYSLWREATAGLPVAVVGDNPGLSAPAAPAELAAAYRGSRVFVNTSLVSPIPTALLEAMACGCAVVTTENCMIGEVVRHGENGLLANTPAEIRSAVERLLVDPVGAEALGRRARETVLRDFAMSRFVREWDALLRGAAEIVYTGA